MCRRTLKQTKLILTRKGLHKLKLCTYTVLELDLQSDESLLFTLCSVPLTQSIYSNFRIKCFFLNIENNL